MHSMAPLKQLSTFFRILWFKDQDLSEIKSFCNIIYYTIQKIRVSIIVCVCVCVCVWGGGGGIEMNALNWSKVMIKAFIMLQKILFQINAVLLNFLFIKEI